jgi:ribosomal protein S12 methylthiotransferase accessory factor
MTVAPEEMLTRARRIVSPRAGIVSRVVLRELAADDPRVYWAASTPGSLVPIADRPALNNGDAASVDPDRAVLKALGESVERYCSALYDERELRLAAYDEVPDAAAPPESFALFSEGQHRTPGFPIAPFTRETRVCWVRGHSLVHDRPTWVPAAFVYVPYRCAPGEAPIRDFISTGLAAGPTLASAAYRAIAEAVERDAFMIVWQNRLPRPHIELVGVRDPFVQELLRAFDGVPVRLSAVLLTLDIDVSVVLVVVASESGRPPLTVLGLGADLSPRRALAAALEEAALGFVAYRRLIAHSPEYWPEPGYRDVVDLERHALAHAVDAALRPSMDFLALPSTTVPLDALPDRSSESAPDNLRTVVDAVAAVGLDVVAVDLTTPDVDDAGFKVVRCVVPGLQPLDTNHTQQHLGGRRLYEVPYRLGLVPRPRSEDELNPDPHPFP